MEIYIKLGTGNGKMMHLCNKRKLPSVGDLVYVKDKNRPEYPRQGALIKDWLHKLNRNDKLPRGKFFKGKKAGKPIILMDEAHLFLGGSSGAAFSRAVIK